MNVAAELAPIVALGKNCWRIEQAERASVIIDASDYYRHIQTAFAAGREQIQIIGWAFDPGIKLEPDQPARRSRRGTLGALFLQLARAQPERQIRILIWSFGLNHWLLIIRHGLLLWRWHRSGNIAFRFDAAHPLGCSHHQKIVVIDDRLAVCGGIDITKGRWDTSAHRDADARRRLPSGLHYGPWHDLTMMVSGPIAQALGELGRERWAAATGQAPQLPLEQRAELWPPKLAVDFANVAVAVSRTRADYREVSAVREIEALYIDMIRAAERFVYLENQYLTSAKVAAAIAERLQRADPPEVVVIMPRHADGWLQRKAMDGARIALARKIAAVDPDNRFRIYVPVTQNGADIYVHSKLAVVDDRLLRVGSANMNNRSLGLDSECDLTIDAALPGNGGSIAAIAALRNRLLGEHLGVPPERVAAALADGGSLIGAIESLRGTGKTLELLDLSPPEGIEKAIAESELLDPVNPDGFFEPLATRGLRRTWQLGVQAFRRRGARG